MSREDRTHSREHALNEREFEMLLRGARQLKSPFDFEARLVVHCTATLGMRAGEVAHLRAGWIDFDERVLEIPSHEECDFGQFDGEVCGYCRNRARDYVSTHTLSLEDAKAEVRDEFEDVDLDDVAIEELARKRIKDEEVTMEEAIERQWQPKTAAAARTIPIDFDVRTLMTLEEFADRHDRFPKSRATVNRRINKAAEVAGLTGRIYPHALRATSANRMVVSGVSAHSLMAIMGWQSFDTARVYVSRNQQAAANELRSKNR